MAQFHWYRAAQGGVSAPARPESECGAKSYALALAEPRLAVLARRLEAQRWLLDAYSIADIYLFTVLNWAQATPVRLEGFRALTAFLSRLRERPALAQVLALETEEFLQQRGRPAALPAVAS